jgi:hypothetical protein
VSLQQLPSGRQAKQHPCAAPLAAGPTMPGRLASGPRGGEAARGCRAQTRKAAQRGEQAAEAQRRGSHKAITPSEAGPPTADGLWRAGGAPLTPALPARPPKSDVRKRKGTTL